jgi:hypothetical protein
VRLLQAGAIYPALKEAVMKVVLALALTAVASLSLPVPVGAAPRLAAYMCQPLSSINLKKCCSASNWRDIILL